MLETVKQLLAQQFEAVFCMLNTCIVRCPDASWNALVGNQPFCQVAFHTLFFADYYLGPDAALFRDQPFHRENETFFADYEQLEDCEPVSLCEREAIKGYMLFCRKKASEVIASETEESLRKPARFERRDFSRAELHVYSIRHIQHHAAQLSLRLRLDADQDIPWIGSSWHDA
jgi:hypothetical protein